jgi:hypothetical protein
MSPVHTEPMECPRCLGIAYPTRADDQGTNYQCFYCSYGFTRPTSDDAFVGAATIGPAIASQLTPGEPGAGSVKADGTPLERALPSTSGEAGPAPKRTSKKAKD